MAKSTEVAKGINTVVQVVKLPANSRTRTTYTFTNGATAVAANDTTMTVVSTPIKLYKGDKLTFGATTVTLSADVAAAVTTLPIVASPGIVAANATAISYGYQTLNNADSADLSIDGKTVDISSFGDTIYTDFAKIQVEASIKLSGIYVATNPAMLNVILPLANTDGELYFVITDQGGSSVEGVAVVEKLGTMTKLRDIKKFDASLKVAGATVTKDASGAVIA